MKPCKLMLLDMPPKCPELMISLLTRRIISCDALMGQLVASAKAAGGCRSSWEQMSTPAGPFCISGANKISVFSCEDRTFALGRMPESAENIM